jgi:hypothetical protein
MATCSFKKFKKEKLCLTDLKYRVQIVERVSRPIHPDDIYNPKTGLDCTTYVTKLEAYGALEQVKGASTSGTASNDINQSLTTAPNITHNCYIRKADLAYSLTNPPTLVSMFPIDVKVNQLLIPDDYGNAHTYSIANVTADPNNNFVELSLMYMGASNQAMTNHG